MGYLAPLKSIKRYESGIWITLHLINTISHPAVNWAATIWQTAAWKKSSSGIYTADVVGLVCSASESVTANERQPEPAGDDSQVTLPSSDPLQLRWEEGGKRKVARQMTETWDDSHSPLSTPTLLRSFTPHLTTATATTTTTTSPHVPITVPSARHCITDWLTDWPTHRLSLLLLLCFIIFYLIHIHADPFMYGGAQWNVKSLNPLQVLLLYTYT